VAILAALLVAATVALIVVGAGLLGPPPPPVIPPPSSSPSAGIVEPSSTPALTPTPSRPAALQWVPQDIGDQPAITYIWRVGEWFIAVGPDSSFADDDQNVDARFIRSRDGRTWEGVPAPVRGMQVETGTVDGDVLWIVGRRGSSADPTRGIWTTRDGATWQRVADVTGLDFGPGRVDTIAHARGGWLALARRWINPEAQDGFMLRSIDGAAWARLPYPDVEGFVGTDGLVSDGERWLLTSYRSVEGEPDSVQALTSDDGVAWTPHFVATLEQGGVARVSSRANAVAWGPRGFVIGGVRHEGEFPHPLAWWSPDGETWTSAAIDTLPGLAGESSFEVVVGFDGGYLASGHRLQDAAAFFSSPDGTNWTQVDDLSGGPLSRVIALAVGDDAYVTGGEDDFGPFIWTAPRP
jgi:hypothetical protein